MSRTCFGILATLSVGSSVVAQTTPELSDANALQSFFWGDYDGDGLEDAFVVTPAAEARLLRNRGDGSFEDITQSSGLAGVVEPRFGVWADVDGDRDLDLFIATLAGRIHLLINREGANFVDSTESAGLDRAGLVLNAYFVDYDRDGLPDLHLRTAQESLLYHNLGAALFERVELPVWGEPDRTEPRVTEPSAPTSEALPAPPAPAGSDEASAGELARAPMPPVEIADQGLETLRLDPFIDEEAEQRAAAIDQPHVAEEFSE